MEAFTHSLLLFLDLMNHYPLFSVGLLLIVGYFLGKLVSLIHLPEITGFIIAGLLLSESVSGPIINWLLKVETAQGFVSHHMSDQLTIVTEVALGFIAITIGGEFYWVKLKRMGKEVLIITVFQIVLTFILVAAGLWLFRLPIPFALMLGAISTATAPAATVAIVQSLRAKGKFIDYLYGVVALDDAGCVIMFGLFFAVAAGLLGAGGGEHGGSAIVILHAFKEVGLSLVVGSFMGWLIHTLTIKRTNNNEILIISIGLIFLSIALAHMFHLSALLTNMAAGTILINLSPKNHRIFRIVGPVTPPIYALFFVLAGTHLNPMVLINVKVLILGSIYILARAIGKYGGVFIGCKVSKLEPAITKNLGLCMLPQAGVAIGLVLYIQAALLGEGSHLSAENIKIVDTMLNIVLLSVFVNEMVGPPISKIAIIKGNKMEKNNGNL